MRRLIRSVLVLVGLILPAFFTACSHYRLGTSGKLSFQTIYVAPVANTADMPQATAIITTALRDAFLRDGRVTLVNSPEAADTTLTIELSRYSRNGTTARGDDTGLARKFDLHIEAKCTLRDNRSNTLLIDHRAIQSTKQIYTTATPSDRISDQQQAEANTLPLLAHDLADRTAHTVLDVW